MQVYLRLIFQLVLILQAMLVILQNLLGLVAALRYFLGSLEVVLIVAGSIDLQLQVVHLLIHRLQAWLPHHQVGPLLDFNLGHRI